MQKNWSHFWLQSIIRTIRNTKIATVQVLTIKLGNCSNCCTVIFHLDKTETLGAACFTIDDDVCTHNGTVLSEKVPKLFFGGVVTHVTNINFLCHDKHPSQA